jgi:glycosyltransferase involved in cell wall biosynthesis
MALPFNDWYRRGRRLAAERVYRALSPGLKTHSSVGRPGVVGFLRSPSGIGESARLCYAAMEKLGLEPEAIDLSVSFQPHAMLPEVPDGKPMGAARGPVVIHANPPELYAALARMRRQVRDRMVIGYWAWELPKAPAAWADGTRYLHEIWVPSAYCAKAIGEWADCPVRVVPHPVAAVPASAPDRSLFRCPESAVVFLAACDLRSSMARKNPQGAIRAFRTAFGDDADRLLVIKVGGRHGNENAYSELAKTADYPNVRLVTDVLTAAEMAAMVAGADVLVSLHRAEGFGLLPAQAMLAGRPVLATDYSATREFLSSDWAELVPARLVKIDDPQGFYLPEYGEWADPDLKQAAEGMVRLAASINLRERLGDAGRKAAERLFSIDMWRQNSGRDFRIACGWPS